jgi:predicted transcriptional regulator
MQSIRQALLFCVLTSGRVAVGEAIDQLPIVNVRLGPPANAQPQVAAEISLLEGARKDMETTHLQELDLAFQHAVNHASSTLSEVITSALGRMPKLKTHKAASLLGVRDGLSVRDNAAQSFAIEVRPPQEPDIAIKAKLDQIEQKRSADEGHIFEQAVSEFAALEAIFTNEVLAQVHAYGNGLKTHKVMGFLQASQGVRRAGSGDPTPGLNVRLSASAQPFPTVEGLALAMESRRDASEEVVRSRVLELESQFFETANDLLHDTLRTSLSRTA